MELLARGVFTEKDTLVQEMDLSNYASNKALTATIARRAWILSTALMLASCEFQSNSTTTGHGRGFENRNAAEVFAEALSAENVPYEMTEIDGLTSVIWKVEYDADADRILRKVEGRPPKGTRSLCFMSEAGQAQFLTTLAASEVPHEVLPHSPDGWCVYWSKDVDDAVANANSDYNEIREMERARGIRD